MKLLSLRFDVDSITCIEKGIPPLRRLADRLGVRFTFFVNMGYSFNWTHNLRHAVAGLTAGGRRESSAPGKVRSALPPTQKLGLAAVIRTVVFNPRLGDRYRSVFDALHADGHELGLHGGTDHVVWQRSLGEMTSAELEQLFRPAYLDFTDRYGPPAGFASPGFQHDERVLGLMDSESFLYGSDMPGEAPFRPVSADGANAYRHFQIPVNVVGDARVPLIEQGIAREHPVAAIVEDATSAIEARQYAVMYGHPYVEGVRAGILGEILDRVRDSHEIVTMSDYLARWKRETHGDPPTVDIPTTRGG